MLETQSIKNSTTYELNPTQLLGSLDEVLQRDGFIIFICGGKEKGKTNLALLLAEWCFAFDYRKRISTNIDTQDFRIEAKITDLKTLESWLEEGGRKLFILDELGKHARRNRFMSSKNVGIMDLCQLIRHYDCGLIGCAPSEVFIDSKFLNTDILDAKIKKITQTTAKIDNFLLKDAYFLNDVPVTSIKYNSKDIAIFTEKPQIKLEDLPLCCRVSATYALTGSYKETLEQIPEITNPNQIRQNIIECLKKHHL